ncbi:hypothetical protein WK56_05865 [Burkholderia ubonensis]|uniref:lysozyme inhibitor LprI family protein n=1 Tax=Burkholderia ubonensis TaxID=101571 RepID=UPI00075722E1|nr:lysozyme inhibitor LprI family protein [Burkholderia ubonensis]KVT75410.1 hypothetical protein WK56_05865 [Burkholderia ubonensis]
MADFPHDEDEYVFSFRYLYLAVAATSVALSAHAAGIDCSAAKTRTDRLICGDKALVSTDGALASAYDATVDAAADPRAVILSQRAWLKQRDACGDAACVAAAYRDRAAALKQVKPAGWKTYRDPALGISFEYLANRQVKKPCPVLGGDRCVAIVGRNMTNSNYFIAFEMRRRRARAGRGKGSRVRAAGRRQMDVDVRPRHAPGSRALHGPGLARHARDDHVRHQRSGNRLPCGGRRMLLGRAEQRQAGSRREYAGNRRHGRLDDAQRLDVPLRPLTGTEGRRAAHARPTICAAQRVLA